MSFSDPIEYVFKNKKWSNGSLNSIIIPSSNFRKNILEILKNEGYIKDYFIEKKDKKIRLR